MTLHLAIFESIAAVFLFNSSKSQLVFSDSSLASQLAYSCSSFQSSLASSSLAWSSTTLSIFSLKNFMASPRVFMSSGSLGKSSGVKGLSLALIIGAGRPAAAAASAALSISSLSSSISVLTTFSSSSLGSSLTLQPLAMALAAPWIYSGVGLFYYRIKIDCSSS